MTLHDMHIVKVNFNFLLKGPQTEKQVTACNKHDNVSEKLSPEQKIPTSSQSRKSPASSANQVETECVITLIHPPHK
jgi:hypothetical protein